MSKLEKYSSYKDSGVEWLGKIPEHWEVTRLCNLGFFSASGIDKFSKKNEPKVNIINYTDVYSNKKHLIHKNQQFMIVTTPKANRIKHLVKKGDLIYLPSSETYEDLGLSALVDDNINNLSFSYHVLRFQFTQDITHEFRKYLTNNNYALNQFSRLGTGSIRKTIGRNVFRNINIIIPPKEEQLKIANFLDTKTTQIDEAIKQKEELIKLLKERRQVLIHKAVTQGLDPTVIMKDSGVEWIGEIPEHWNILPGFKVYKQNKSKNIGMIENTVLSLSYGNIVIKPEEKLVGLVPESFETYQIVNPGDIIVRCMDLQNDKTSLRTGIARDRGIITSAYLNLNVFNNVIPEYLHHYLHMLDITKVVYKFGTGLRQNLSYFDFKRLPIVFPKKDEQQEILEYIEINTTRIDSLIKLQEEYINQLKEYKGTFIDSCVTGKVKV